jgi:hypothetical protein
MAGKNKRIKLELSRFLRYTGNKMSDSERNSVERELQKDPFSEEAVEGFEGISADSVKRDLRILKNKIQSGGNKRHIYLYSIAASVAVLLSISTLFLIIKNYKNEALISDNKTGVQFEITKTVPLSEPKKRQEQQTIKDEVKKAGKPKQNTENTKKPDKQEFQARDKPIIYDSILKVPVALSRSVAENIRIPEAKPETARTITRSEIIQAAVGGNVFKGKVFSSEDEQPIPGATILLKGTSRGTVTDTGGNFILSLPDSSMHSLVASFIGMDSKEFTAIADSSVNVSLNPSRIALNEVVVVGYGTQKNAKTDIAGAANTIVNENSARTNYTPPLPVGGKDNFDKYIDKNIRWPSGIKPGVRAIVVVGFTVKSSGVLENLRIIRSPGKEFSDEALRLIKQGPAWIPAEEDNRKTDDDVRIRIVFR